MTSIAHFRIGEYQFAAGWPHKVLSYSGYTSCPIGRVANGDGTCAACPAGYKAMNKCEQSNTCIYGPGPVAEKDANRKTRREKFTNKKQLKYFSIALNDTIAYYPDNGEVYFGNVLSKASNEIIMDMTAYKDDELQYVGGVNNTNTNTMNSGVTKVVTLKWTCGTHAGGDYCDEGDGNEPTMITTGAWAGGKVVEAATARKYPILDGNIKIYFFNHCSIYYYFCFIKYKLIYYL